MQKNEPRQPQPYEVMPEGEPHAVADWAARVISVLLLALIGGLIGTAAKADDTYPKTVSNWCADWQEGYEYSFYLKCRSCQEIEPQQCPEPEHPDQDGTLKGIKDGATDGKREQERWL